MYLVSITTSHMQTPDLSTDSVLYLFWQRTQGLSSLQPAPHEWNEQVLLLSKYSRGIEEALSYLYGNRPTYETFTQWLQQTPMQQDVAACAEILTAEDLAFWSANGYIVVKNAIPQEQYTAARDAIWDFLGADPEVPESWYGDHKGKNGMMLSFFQHTALQANRASPRIKSIYKQLYGERDIYLLMDKVSFNPPETDSFKFKGSPLHWDVSLHPPIPYELQGLLYLTDTAADDGAFHCVPGFHNSIVDWLASMPEGADPRTIAIQELTPVAVPGNAGDLVIWHHALPHCATPNTGTTPRMVQYIAYKQVISNTATIWR